MGKIPEPSVRLRIDNVELVDPDSRTITALWWDAYLEAAARLVPEVMASLLTPKGLDSDSTGGPGVIGDENDRDRHISKWCKIWGFSRYYVKTPAWNTINAALGARMRGEPLPDSLVCNAWGRHYARWAGRGDKGIGVIGYHKQTDDPEGDPHPWPELHGRKLSGKTWNAEPGRTPPALAGEIGTQVVLPLPTFFWDPTRETRAVARDRILETIGDMIDRDLETIETAYRAHGYTDPLDKRQRKHVEWLVRYQLLEERKPKIAEAEGTGERHVRRAVKEVADALGIEPRKEKTGRPPGSRDRRPRYRVEPGP